MKHVKLLIESAYLVDPETLKIVYSPDAELVSKKNNFEDEFGIENIFDGSTCKLVVEKINILMLEDTLDELTIIVKSDLALKGPEMFSIKVKKIMDLSSLLLEIKVGRIKKTAFNSIINIRELSADWRG